MKEGIRAPRRTGPFSVPKKPRRVRARRREDIEIRFLRRHKVNCPKGAREGPLGDVRRRKHFSPRKRANCPCSTDSECAAAGCNPFVKKGFTFFDSLKPAWLQAGFMRL